MKSKSRLILIAIAISAVLVSLALYQPILAVGSNGKTGPPKWHGQHMMEMRSDFRFNRRPMLELRLLRNCKPATIEGSIVAYVKHFLVLDTGGEQVRVIVPYLWIVDGEVMNMTEIFDSDILSLGESVEVNALRWNVENEDLTIYVLFGYEIEYDDGKVLYALLPINIEE